jgi:hypothetical protein
MYIINDNGTRREATAQEQADIEAREKAWTEDTLNRKLNAIKEIRLQKLQQTDYLGLSDVTMSDAIKTWRQSLRDLPQNNTTEEQYDALLARDEQGNLTHTVWEKP